MDTLYLGKFGQLSVLDSQFLSDADINRLMELNSIDEFISYLRNKDYSDDISQFINSYKGDELILRILNYHTVKMVRNSTSYLYSVTKAFIGAYLSKFDIENIKVILSSKTLNYDIKNVEPFLVINDSPIGYFGGSISNEDYKLILGQLDVESIVNTLVKYGFGLVMMQFIDDYKRTGTLSRMFQALDKYYYTNLLDKYNTYGRGSINIREYISDLIDTENISLIFKSINYKYDIEDLIIDGGNIPKSELLNIKVDNLDNLSKIGGFDLSDALSLYKKTGLLIFIDTKLKYLLYSKYIGRLAMSSDMDFILYYILRSEVERFNLRLIIFGKDYHMDDAFIRGNLIMFKK